VQIKAFHPKDLSVTMVHYGQTKLATAKIPEILAQISSHLINCLVSDPQAINGKWN